MKEDESVPEMFYRIQVIVNDLKALGEKVNNDDVSHRFLMCLPPRFDTLRTIFIRGGLKDLTPNQVLGDVMQQETYRVEREGGEQEEEKKKTLAFKAKSSKSKGQTKREQTSDDEDDGDINDETMALFMRKFGKFMKKKGYGARKRRDNFNGKNLMADCPYDTNSDSDQEEKKREKKDKKDKKEKKLSLKKSKKGGGYVVTLGQ